MVIVKFFESVFTSTIVIFISSCFSRYFLNKALRKTVSIHSTVEVQLLPSMNNAIRKHNSKILKDPAPSTTETCNCRLKKDCPMDGICLSGCFI